MTIKELIAALNFMSEHHGEDVDVRFSDALFGILPVNRISVHETYQGEEYDRLFNVIVLDWQREIDGDV